VELALATGMRLQEFSSLLTWEIPPLPSAPTKVPVPAAIAKGSKFRITWISYDALAAVHHYLELDRPATTDGTSWRPPARSGGPLLVTDPDERGGRVNGVRRRWETLTPAERRRLVAPAAGRASWPRSPAEARSLPGRRCSSAPRTGSGPAGSPGSRTSTRTGCATFANDWLDGGGSEGDLMRLMGWKSRSMVDRYARDMQVARAVKAKRARGDMY
jgi:hypothetical protein